VESDLNRSSRLLILLRTTLGTLLALIVVIAFFTIADNLQSGGGRFATVKNAQNIVVQSATVGVAALGMTIIIVSGGIDLSAGTGMALCAVVLAWCLRADYAPSLAIAAGILAGGLIGAVNGLLISILRVVPFIVTLGTMTIFLGLSKVIAENRTIRPAPEQVPEWIPQLLNPRIDTPWMLFPAGVWFLISLSLVVALLLKFTVLGRHITSMGANQRAAWLCGINLFRTRMIVYTLGGVTVGIAGVFQFARLTSANPTSGTGKELLIIASVIIGGGSLNGGRGSILGTLAGALLMQVISSGCTALKLPNPIQEIIIGTIIVAAVTLDQWRQGRVFARHAKN